MKPAIGLTGGIGSGKSTVAARLAARGAGVVDTDALSHALTAPGGTAMSAIRAAFGPAMVAPDGALDRAAMRDAVFRDAAMRKRLESILHPMIRLQVELAWTQAPGPYVLLVVPLLFESRAYEGRVARTLCVDCPEAQQLARAAARSNIAVDEVARIMAAQWPRWRRLQLADDVAWNGGAPEALDAQCDRLHARYAHLA